MGVPALIGLALTAAGTGAQMAAKSSEAAKMNDASKAELIRQQGYRKTADTQFNTSLNQSGSTQGGQAIGAAAQNVQQKYQNAQSAPLSTAASPIQANPVVDARQAAFTNQQQGADAKLQGYSQWGVDQAIKNMLASQQLGLTGTLARQSAGVLPLELQNAQQSSAGLAGVGSLLSTLGSAVGVAGSLGGWGKGAPLSSTKGYTNIGQFSAPPLNVPTGLYQSYIH